MSVALIGGLVGLLVALVDLFFLRLLAGRVDLAETKMALNVAGLVQLVLLPITGWFVAPMMFGD